MEVLESYCVECKTRLDIPLDVSIQAELERRDEDIDIVGFLCTECEKDVE